MSRAYTDERIDVAVGVTATLTRSKLEPSGLSHARSVTIENSTAAGSDVLYRFGSAPTTAPVAGHRLIPGASIEISGYDNLVSIQFLGAGTNPASLFVTFWT
jgi:hypothetical protein